MGTSTARASIPASSASARVLPTAATCGSVKVTRGEPMPSATASISRPSRFSAATQAWYLPTWVKRAAAVDVADRVEPVVAADPHPVVDLEEAVLVGLDPDRVEAEVVGVGLAADGDEDLLAPRPRRRRPARRSRRRRPRGPLGQVADRTSTPKRPRSAAATSSPAKGSSRRAGAAALDQRHLRPQRRPGLRRARADRAAAEHDHARRDPSRRWSRRGCSRPGPSRGRRSAASRHRGRWRRSSPARRSASSSPTRSGRCRRNVSLAAVEVDLRVLPARAAAPSRPHRGSPRRGGRGSRAVRARRHRRPATPGMRLASARTSAGRSSAFEGMQA